MINRFLKIAFRNLMKHKGTALINVFGLSVSLTATLMLLFTVKHELSYDSFNEHKHRTYRFITTISKPGGTILNAPLTIGMLSEELPNQTSVIDKISRVDKLSMKVRYNENTFHNISTIRTDSIFFHIFSFKVLDGNPYATLSQPNEVAITKSVVQKIFGSKYPIGKSIEIDGKNFEVTSLLADIPTNSHLKFDLVTSFLDISDLYNYLNQRGFAFSCYFTTHTPLTSEYEKEIVMIAEQLSNIRFEKSDRKASIKTQPLLDIHLKSSDLEYDIDGTGNVSQLIVFGVIALILFSIATINFINLFIANAETRSKSIWVSKIHGADQKHIAIQFLCESLILSLVSILFAVIITEIALSHFCHLFNIKASNTILSVQNIAIAIAAGVFAGLLTGFYPSFIQKQIFTQQDLSKAKVNGKGISKLQLSLIVFQFAIAVFLIVVVISVNRQVSFLNSKHLGFSNQTYVIENLTRKTMQGFHSLKYELEQIPNIEMISGAHGIPGKQSNTVSAWNSNQLMEEAVLVQENKVQDNYLRTLGIPILEGRDFNIDLASDSLAFILNQAAVRKLGLSNPVGSRIYVNNQLGTVIGVTSDYHIRSLHSEIEPIILTRLSPIPYHILVSINSVNPKSTIEQIESTVKRFDETWGGGGRYIKDFFQGQYQKEEKHRKLFFVSSLLTIIVACLGIFALTTIITQGKTKEVGIRKTLGASSFRISIELAWSITRWVLVSCIIAYPIAWISTERYLQYFAYKVNQHIGVFILATLACFVLAFLTVLVQSSRIARENPVISLKYE